MPEGLLRREVPLVHDVLPQQHLDGGRQRLEEVAGDPYRFRPFPAPPAGGLMRQESPGVGIQDGASVEAQDVDGRHETREATGNGPVDATFNAIKTIVPNEATLSLYQVHAVTEGTDAQAEVSVRLEEDGRSVTARSSDPDTLVASAKAYVSGINKLMTRRGKTKPEALTAV